MKVDPEPEPIEFKKVKDEGETVDSAKAVPRPLIPADLGNSGSDGDPEGHSGDRIRTSDIGRRTTTNGGEISPRCRLRKA